MATLMSVLLFSPLATAATYTVGPGGDYETLEALRTSGVLQNGDTIVMNGDDMSLTNCFTHRGTAATKVGSP